MGRTATALAGAILATLAVVGTTGAPAAGQSPEDPAYSVDPATLDAALDCDPFTHPGTEPVLLVHGTGTMGHEQYDWNYALLLRSTGHDVCILTYPDRGFGDMQVSAEYVARAVQRIHAESGRQVDMIGHSQGGVMPRWAIKWWPSVQAALDDFVMLAGVNHGTTVATGSFPGGQPAVFFQFRPGSAFNRALNAGDETPGDVDYTSIYTAFDELVRPPETAALDRSSPGPSTANIRIQDLCPLRVVDHLSIGTTDVLTQHLVLDALDGDGPADPVRAGVDPVLCNLPDQYVVPDTFPNLVAQFQTSFAAGFPDYQRVTEEPPLRDYATQGRSSAPTTTATTAIVDDPAPQPLPRTDTGPSLPATGRAMPILAAGIAIGVALLLRAGRSRFDDDDPDL